MRRASVECKDFSGLVGFDYYELHFFPPLGPSFWVSDSGFRFLGPILGGPIQDSGFWVPFPIQDSGFWVPFWGV